MTHQPNNRTAIHNIGYQLYQGARRPQSTRWRVIVRHFLLQSWSGWWRSKIWLGGTLATIISLCAVLYLLRAHHLSELIRLPSSGKTSSVSMIEGLVPFCYRAFLLPLLAFILSMTLVAPSVARDMQSGGFEFYFSRPLRPIDYVLGKLIGGLIFVGSILLLAPIIVCLFRLGLCENVAELRENAPILLNIVLIGSLSSLTYVALPLAISSLVKSPATALILWAALYFIAGGLFQGLAHILEQPLLAAFDIKSAILGLTFGLFGFGFRSNQVIPPTMASALSLLAFSTLSLVVLYRRLQLAKRRGITGNP